MRSCRPDIVNWTFPQCRAWSCTGDSLAEFSVMHTLASVRGSRRLGAGPADARRHRRRGVGLCDHPAARHERLANWLDGGSRPRPRWRGNKAYRWVSTAIDSGASSLMNTGLIMCDWNSHLLSHSDTHSLTRSATNIGGFDCVTGGRAEAP
jgi:hypothetical protein